MKNIRLTALSISHICAFWFRSRVWKRGMSQLFSNSFSRQQIMCLVSNEMSIHYMFYATTGLLCRAHNHFSAVKNTTSIRVRENSFKATIFSSFYRFSNIYMLLS